MSERVQPCLEEQTIETEKDETTESVSEVERQNFASRVIESAVNLVKRPSKRAKILIGLLTFFAGAGYLKRNEVVTWGARAVMQNPHIMNTFDRHFNQGLENAEEQQDLDIDEQGEEARGVGVKIEINGNTINSFPSTSYIKAPDERKIEIEDPYLKNLLQENYQKVKKPKNPEAFDHFLIQEINFFLNQKNNKSLRESYEKGNVGSIIELVDSVVRKNMDYDKNTSVWLQTGENGRLGLKWGKTSPVKAFFSTDGIAVDELLMKSHMGVCRQFSDALGLVTEELKKIYPEKFQNLYVVSFQNSYQWHVYNLLLVARSGKEFDAVEIEPQDGSGGSPSYELIKMMYDRKIINKDEYFEGMRKILEIKGDRTIDFVDIYAVIESAKTSNKQEVIDAVKRYFVKNGSLNSVLYLEKNGFIAHSEKIDAIVGLLNHPMVDGELLQYTADLAETTNEPGVTQKLFSALRSICLNPDFTKVAGNQYFELLTRIRQDGQISDPEYIQIGRTLIKINCFDKQGTEIIGYLLTKKEYFSIAREFLMHILSPAVTYPLSISRDFGKGEYTHWSQKDAIEEPLRYRDYILKSFAPELDKYLKETNEDLVADTGKSFKVNMDNLRNNLKNFKR